MHNGRNLVFLFDGTFDGFLNVIYVYYYEKSIPKYIFPESGFQQVLGGEYVNIETDGTKAEKVFNAVKKNLTAAENLFNAFLNSDEERYMDLFKYALLCFKAKGAVDNHRQLDYVLRTQKYALAVTNEARSLKGFCRFSKTAQGVYYAKITPKHNLLPILSEHFTDRFMDWKWIIHDTNRGTASIYDGRNWFIAEVGPYADIEYSEDEKEYQRMWKSFCECIANEERINIKLQKQFIRSGHRRNMTEFKTLN